jgi:CHAD domain-containing protein
MANTTLRRVFDEQWTRWQRSVEACRDGLDHGAVHDLRVGSRRVLSLLDLVRELSDVPRKADERVTAALRALLDALGPLRDAQNERRRVKHARPGAGIEPLRRHLKQREARHARRARRAVARAGGARVRKDGARLRAAIVAGARTETPAERYLRLAKALDLAAAGVRIPLARLDVAKPRRVHGLRVALRQFRYVAELAARLSPAFRASGQATARALQGRLGRAHDTDVLLDRLDRFARRHPGEAGPGLDALRRTLHAERDRQLTGLTRALTPLRHALTAVADRAASRAALRLASAAAVPAATAAARRRTR